MVRVGTASLVAALSSYLLNVLAAWFLPVQENTVLLTLLAILFFYYAILSAITTEFTRSISAALQHDQATGSPAWRVALVLAGIVGVSVVLTSPIWQIATPSGVSPYLVAAMTIGMAGYSFHCTSCGVLAGSGRWSVMSLLVGAEGVSRMALAAIVTLAASATGYLLAVVVASFTWVLFLMWSPTTRFALRLPTDRPVRELLPRFGAAFLAQGASSVLTVGFPMFLAITTPAGEYATKAPLLLAISLTRAPLLIPLSAYQSVIVRRFVRAGAAAPQGLGAIVVGCVGIGAVGGIAAYLIGPTLMVWIFSGAYHVDGWVLAGLVFAAAGVALITVTGAMAQALANHGAFVLGWLTAVAVTAGLLLLPGTIEARAIFALTIGPIMGSILHMVALFLGRIAAQRASGPNHGASTPDGQGS